MGTCYSSPGRSRGAGDERDHLAPRPPDGQTSMIAQLPLTISEADFQRTVIDAAGRFGWMVHHARPSRTAKGWATILTGDPGLPDLVLARGGVVILAELKRHGGRATPGQVRWLDALGRYGRLWTPSQWQHIVIELRDGPAYQQGDVA